MLPWKKIENLYLQTAGNALKLSILPSPCYFASFLKIFYNPIRWIFLAPGGGGGGGVRAHLVHPPAYGPVTKLQIAAWILLHVIVKCKL